MITNHNACFVLDPIDYAFMMQDGQMNKEDMPKDIGPDEVAGRVYPRKRCSL